MANYKVSITLDAQDKASPAFKELNKQLDQTKKGAADVNQSSGGLLDRFGGLTGVVTAAAGAFAALQLGQKILELRDLGAAATAAGNTFEQLSGGAIAARANLDAMRAATRGVVDDTTLMGGANRLLLMNLASTGEEAAKLTGIAVALGRAMGQDAAASVADFASLLANQSIPRLDNFGISSANVRARIEELTTGVGALSREAAFTQAVLEEGTTSMDRLGSSIDANASQWDRLMTTATNAMQGIGSVVFSVGEGIAGALNGIITAVTQGADTGMTAVEGAAQRALDRAREVRAEYEALLLLQQGVQPSGNAGASGTQQPAVNPQAILTATAVDVVAAAERANWTATFESSIASWEAANDEVIRTEGQLAQAIDEWQGSDVWDTLPEEMRNAAIFYAQERAGRWGYGPISGVVAGAEAGGQAGLVRGVDADLLRGAQQYQNALAEREVERQAEASRRQIERERASLLALRSMQQTYASMDQMGLAAGFDTTPEALRQMQAGQREQAQTRNYTDQMYGALREQRQQAAGEWAAQGILDLWGGLTERGTQIANSFRDAVESARTIQSKLGEAGDKLATSLSGVLNLGVTGGFQGDVYSQIAQLITDESARQQFELGTGLSTTGQGAFQDVAALIAGMGGQEQIGAAQGLAAFMQSGMFRPDMTTADIMSQLGYMGKPGGQQFQVFAGDTYAAIQARTGMNADQVMNAAGITDSRYLLPGMYGAGDSFARFTSGKGDREDQDPMRQIEESALGAYEKVKEVQTAIDEIKDSTATLTLKIASDTSGLAPIFQEILKYSSVAQLLESVGQKNGGSTPGNSARAQAGRMGEKR